MGRKQLCFRFRKRNEQQIAGGFPTQKQNQLLAPAPEPALVEGRRFNGGGGLARCFDLEEERRTLTWPMHVTFGEEGSSMAVDLFRRVKSGVERERALLLLLAVLPRRNLINGAGYLSGRPGLEMGLLAGANDFIF